MEKNKRNEKVYIITLLVCTYSISLTKVGQLKNVCRKYAANAAMHDIFDLDNTFSGKRRGIVLYGPTIEYSIFIPFN